ncbi:hypothetical protein ACWGKW_30355 [Streptomyces sp. NPDC054766]
MPGQLCGEGADAVRHAVQGVWCGCGADGRIDQDAQLMAKRGDRPPLQMQFLLV